MSTDVQVEYARDDFRYPRWLQRLLIAGLNFGNRFLESRQIQEGTLILLRRIFLALGIVLLLLGWYLFSALAIGIWLFLDQLHLQRHVDRDNPASRLRHFGEEAIIPLGLAIHMWLGGFWLTGLAAIVGIAGMYLLSTLQMKHDLAKLQLPSLYFLRWDRMGFMFLFILLGAWPGTRSYLWPRLAAWFLPVLTFYDYIWIVIQMAKKRK